MTDVPRMQVGDSKLNSACSDSVMSVHDAHEDPFSPHHQPGPSGNSSDILINLPPDSQGYVTPPGSFVSMGSSPQQESLLSDLPVTVSAPASGMSSTQFHYLCLPNAVVLVAHDTSQHPFLLPLLTEPHLQMICLIGACGLYMF